MELKGPVDLLGLSHLLRVGEIYRSSFSVALEHPIGRGEILLGNGLVVWARLGRTRGVEALRTLISWRGATFRIYPPAVPGDRNGGLSPRVVLDYGMDRSPVDVEGVSTEGPVQGSLALLSLRQVLHIFQANRRGAVIHITSRGPKGEIHVDSGSVVSAGSAEMTGPDAVGALLEAQGCETEILACPGAVESNGSFPIDHFLEPTREKEHDEADIARNEKVFALAPLPDRIKMARQGDFKERLLAACSGSDQVAMAVVQDGNLGQELAEALASKVMANPEVLTFLGTNRAFRKQHGVVRALVFNPTTPLSTAVNLMQDLCDADVRKVMTDTTAYPEALRARAKRTLEIRKKKRSF